jgi:hypothetical protein
MGFLGCHCEPSDVLLDGEAISWQRQGLLQAQRTSHCNDIATLFKKVVVKIPIVIIGIV